MTRISFFKASRRLLSDGGHLAADSRADRSLNAAHLHGLSAECGLKYLLLLCGALQRDGTTGDLTGRRPHVDRIVDSSGLATEYQTLVSGHTHSRYFASLSGLSSLRSWKPDFRYFDDVHPDYPKADEATWVNASHEIQAALDAALLDGQPIY